MSRLFYIKRTLHVKLPTELPGEWIGIKEKYFSTQGTVDIRSPSTNKILASVKHNTADDMKAAITNAHKAYKQFANIPAPQRGLIVKDIRDAFAANKGELALIISLEMGKIYEEALGEVQETIDICDYAVGLSRMLNGKVIPSERPNHAMLEVFNPLGVVGCITAFNFPNAVFGWNAALAWITGNSVVWKPSPTTPLTAIATNHLVQQVFKRHSLPVALSSLILGDVDVGKILVNDRRVALLSFTGSTKIGKIVNEERAKWCGQTLLELGGNNALIVLEDANIDMAVRGALFASVGTSGQRCTTTRRLLLHENIYDEFLDKLTVAYKTIKIGDPLVPGTLCGPLHSHNQVLQYESLVQSIKKQGGKIRCGGKVISSTTKKHEGCNGNFVFPTISEIDKDSDLLQHEVFVPVVHAIKIKNIDEAIKINNNVQQGLSSSLFTEDITNMFKWIGPNGSDCGIVNVNIPTNGAEIGGAFGGNKETGWGRESGSDSWKLYCRQSTCTINYSKKLPLAQGITFE
eukprot:NODE_501_length_7561_cov_0.489547.p1 type:complete len:518 gc:universal NODE_501_length_7561_cov_0.489547:3601-2048(-)